jgi:uncharacterized membrane protein
MKTMQATQWEFGGWLAGLTPWVSGLILAGMLLLAVSLALLSYRHLLRPISPWLRWVLVSLRTALFLIIFLCLANPTRIEKEVLQSNGDKRVAVVVDVSDSMTTRDNRNKSRLDQASDHWKQWKSAAERHFKQVSYFQMAQQTLPMDSLLSCLKPAGATSDTGFYQSLESLINPGQGRYDAVIYLTDALDTMSEAGAKNLLLQQARERQVPVYFIPGSNRMEGRAQLAIQEVIVPPRVVQKSGFQYEAILKMSGGKVRDVPLKLFRNNELIAEAKIRAGGGNTVRKWSLALEAKEAEVLQLRLEVGDAEVRDSALTEVQVLTHLPKKVLFYLGALDWGYRYFSDALAQDPSFELSTVFGPGVGMRASSIPAGAPVLDAFPSSAAKLAAYDLVVLAEVYLEDLSLTQQEELAAYTRGGGSVLFIMSNSEGSREYAGSVIEKMLPVVLAVSEQQVEDTDARNFQEKMRRERSGMSNDKESLYAAAAAKEQKNIPLYPVTIVPDSELGELFKHLTLTQGEASWVPQYFARAAVEYSKAAAKVQSVRAQDDGTTILLATQSFGSGKTSLLATDMFWLWHLSQPSSKQKTPIFWQQLVTWLSRSADSGLRFIYAPQKVTALGSATFKVGGSSGALTAVLENVDRNIKIPVLVPEPDTDGVRSLPVAPAEPGAWTLRVIEPETGRFANAHFDVNEQVPAKESDLVPVDVDLMREIALQTGGEVFQHGVPSEWKSAGEEGVVVKEHRILLWHQGWLFAIIALLYVTELLLRRKAKLL